MEVGDLAAKIEAVLFARGESIRVGELARALGVSEEDTRRALGVLAEGYRQNHRGLALIEHGEAVALGTRPEFGELVRKFFGEEFRQELTPAALETLAIIAYRGPISRPAIDAIRGVNSTFMVRNLMLRGLIERAPDPKRHNVWLYEITLDCMKMLGIQRREDLPEFASLSQSLDALQAPATEPSM
jgi:segregation and condensation protein B